MLSSFHADRLRSINRGTEIAVFRTYAAGGDVHRDEVNRFLTFSAAAKYAEKFEARAGEQLSIEEVDREVVHGSFVRAELFEVFEEVSDDERWKNPIRVEVSHDLVEVVSMAIGFYHGEMPKVTQKGGNGGLYVVKGNGYAAD